LRIGSRDTVSGLGCTKGNAVEQPGAVAFTASVRKASPAIGINRGVYPNETRIKHVAARWVDIQQVVGAAIIRSIPLESIKAMVFKRIRRRSNLGHNCRSRELIVKVLPMSRH